MLAQAGMAHAATEKYESKTTVVKKDDGSYERKDVTTKTDQTGNSVTLEKKVDVDVGKDGTYNAKTDTKQINDPKGLLNKHVVETVDTSKISDGKLVATHEKKVDGKTVAGVKDKYKSTTKVSEDATGNYDENTKVSTVSPTGTKTTYEKKAVVDVHNDGSIDKATTTKEVDDPKGLGNKTTTTSANTQNISDGVVTNGQEIKVDGKVVESQKTVTPQ